MKSNYLLPPCFKRIGWILFVPFAVLGIWEIYTYGLILGEYGVPGLPVLPQWKGAHSMITDFPFSWDGWDELLIIGLIVSLIFIAFSQEKQEDECILKIRMESLVWAIQANFLIIIIGTLCIYTTYYLIFLVLNIYTVLILYIIKFRIAIHNLNKAVKNEE